MFWFLLYSAVERRHKSSFTTSCLCVIHVFRCTLLLEALMCYKCLYSLSCYATYVVVLLSAGMELILVPAVGTVLWFGFRVSITLTIDWIFGWGWPGLALSQRHFRDIRSCPPANEEVEGAQEAGKRQSCDSFDPRGVPHHLVSFWAIKLGWVCCGVRAHCSGAKWALVSRSWPIALCITCSIFLFFPIPFLSD